MLLSGAYVTSEELHQNLDIRSISEVIAELAVNYERRLFGHINVEIVQPVDNTQILDSEELDELMSEMSVLLNSISVDRQRNRAYVLHAD